jgi:hypothetical protein
VGQGHQTCGREAVSAIWVVRSGSNGGNQTKGVEWLRAALLLSAAVKSLELRQARARGVPGLPGLGREGEGATANSMARKRPRIQGQRRKNDGEKVWADQRSSIEAFQPQGRGLRCAKAWASFSRGGGDTGTSSGELDGAKSASHRASTADHRVRAPAMPKLVEHRAESGKLGMGKCVSPWGGAWGGLARSPAS